MEVKVTGHSHNLRATLQYIYGNHNQAHKNPNHVAKRNKILIGMGGVPGGAGFDSVYRAMSHWNRKKPRNKVKSTEIVLSFSHDELRFESGPEDVSRGVAISRDFAHRAFPHHAILLAPQNDNPNETSHVHVIVDEISEQNLKALKGSEYGVQKLRHYAKQALADYDNDRAYQGEPITKLTRKGDRQPTRFERIVINRLRPVLADSRITSQSKFRKACKAHNVRAKFVRHRHYITKRGKDGKKHYVLMSNGKRKYTLSHGLVFKAIGKHVSRGYIRASNLSSFDSRLSYQNIQSMFKSNKHLARQKKVDPIRKSVSRYSSEDTTPPPAPSRSVPVQSSSSYSSSASSSSITQSSHYNSVQSNIAINNEYLNRVAIENEKKSKKRKQKKIHERKLHDKNVAVARYKSSLKSKISAHKASFNQQWNDNANAYHMDSKRAINDYQSSLSSITSMKLTPTSARALTAYNFLDRQNDKTAKDEADRVNYAMPRFSNLDAQRYAYWGYNHVIPAKVVGYDGKIPEFAMDQNDKGLFQRMTEPVVKTLKRAKSVGLTMWRAGKRAIKNYCIEYRVPIVGAKKWFTDTTDEDGRPLRTEHREPLINDLAKRDGVLRTPKHLLLVKAFRSGWHSIKSRFRSFLHPVVQQSKASFNAYADASRAKVSLVEDKNNLEDNAKLNYQATSQAQLSRLNKDQNGLKSSDKIWWSSLDDSIAMRTPSGRASLSAKRSSQAEAESEATKSPNASGKTPKTPGGDGDEIE